MTDQNAVHRENLERIRAELFRLLEGMDYCLDWKAGPEEWSAKEIITHLLDTPPGGIPAALRGILSGQLAELELWADQSYITPEKLAWDIEETRRHLNDYFGALAEALETAGATDLAARSIMVHQRNRHWDEERPVPWLLERLFAGHWGEHLVQLRELREALGLATEG